MDQPLFSEILIPLDESESPQVIEERRKRCEEIAQAYCEKLGPKDEFEFKTHPIIIQKRAAHTPRTLVTRYGDGKLMTPSGGLPSCYDVVEPIEDWSRYDVDEPIEDCRLGFLKEKLSRDTGFIPFAKHLIINIEEELMSLRPYLNDLFEQQKEQEELKDTWLKFIDLAYQTEYAINSCSVIDHQLWYNMTRLMEVLDEINVVKSKFKKIEGRKTHDGGGLHCSAVALNKVREDPWNLGFNQVMVGLKKEVDLIVINGSKFLDIVAVVGMAGLGKTTYYQRYCANQQTMRSYAEAIICDVKSFGEARVSFQQTQDLIRILSRRCFRIPMDQPLFSEILIPESPEVIEERIWTRS